jgi:hypothetical protein
VRRERGRQGDFQRPLPSVLTAMADHFHHHHENHQGTPVSPGILKKTSDSLHADGTPWSSMPPPSAVKLHSGGFSLSVGSPQADGQCMWRQEAQKWKDIALSDRRELNHKVARLEAEVMEVRSQSLHPHTTTVLCSVSLLLLEAKQHAQAWS